MIPFKELIFRQGGKQKGGATAAEERPQIKKTLRNGRMAVTNQRLIFICECLLIWTMQLQQEFQ